MKIADQIRELVKHKNTTITELATNINTTQANLANKLVRDNLRINELEEIVTALGYVGIEILLRGENEDAVILEDEVRYKPHNTYMVTKNTDTLDDIKNGRLKDRQFKDLVFEVLEPALKDKFINTWDAYVSKDLEELVKDAIKRNIKLNLSPIKSKED